MAIRRGREDMTSPHPEWAARGRLRIQCVDQEIGPGELWCIRDVSGYASD